MAPMNLSRKQRETHKENRPVVAKGGVGRERMDWELWVSILKLLYIPWINNKVLRYSIGCCMQSPGINRMEKHVRKNTHMYIHN